MASLLGTERFSVQPVATSVTVSVNANGPAGLPPSWETKSISTNPVGVVPVGPGAYRDLTFQQRSRLGGATPLELTFGSFTCQATINGGRRHRHQQFCGVIIDDQLPKMPQHRHEFAQHRRQPLAGRHPQHEPATVSAAITSGPYFGGRGLRLGATTLGRNAALSALRAWLRCQPVLAHNSSRILPLTRAYPPHVADRGRLGHSPALGQRQPHLTDVRAHSQ